MKHFNTLIIDDHIPALISEAYLLLQSGSIEVLPQVQQFIEDCRRFQYDEYFEIEFNLLVTKYYLVKFEHRNTSKDLDRCYAYLMLTLNLLLNQARLPIIVLHSMHPITWLHGQEYNASTKHIGIRRILFDLEDQLDFPDKGVSTKNRNYEK